jgi:hypothetical protein
VVEVLPSNLAFPAAGIVVLTVPAIPRHSDDDDQGQNKRVPNLSGMNFQAVRSDRSSQGEAAGYLDAAATPSDLLA